MPSKRSRAWNKRQMDKIQRKKATAKLLGGGGIVLYNPVFSEVSIVVEKSEIKVHEVEGKWPLAPTYDRVVTDLRRKKKSK